MKRDHWYLTEGLIFAHIAVFILTYTRESREVIMDLAMIPAYVPSQPWRLITFQFIEGGTFGLLISMYVMWIMARPLEEEWGSFRFLLFWLISVFGASGTAFFLGQPLAGNIFYATSLLFTYATVYPDREFLLFFVLPVKVKWLAIIFGSGMLLSSFLDRGLLTGLANAVGMSAGYAFFLLIRKLPNRRKLAFELKKRKSEAIAAAQGAATEGRNQGWDAAVRAAESRARELGTVADEDAALLAELDAAVDATITVCAPEDFRHVDDPVCRSCTGYPECAARSIRMAAKEKKS
jgi:membrane associated rhomboid family serine protease